MKKTNKKPPKAYKKIEVIIEKTQGTVPEAKQEIHRLLEMQLMEWMRKNP